MDHAYEHICQVSCLYPEVQDSCHFHLHYKIDCSKQLVSSSTKGSPPASARISSIHGALPTVASCFQDG